MKTYSYNIATDVLDQPTSIEFETIKDYKEFLKQLLQIIGMFNFVVKEHQNIWQNNEAFIDLNSPQGSLIIKINLQKRISLLANGNSKDLLKIAAVLNKFSVFRRVDLQLPKSA
ncbi:MAG: hypothetical protein AB8B59_06220 [Maribacter sp.]